jgi:hypothetical protein
MRLVVAALKDDPITPAAQRTTSYAPPVLAASPPPDFHREVFALLTQVVLNHWPTEIRRNAAVRRESLLISWNPTMSTLA